MSQVSKKDIEEADDLTVKPGVALDVRVAKKLLAVQGKCQANKLQFGMTFKRLKQLMQQETCFYTGIKFVDSSNLLARSLDRVDNDKGYTDENVVACTRIINSHKSNITIRELQAVYKGVNKFLTRQKAKAKPKSKLAKLIIVRSQKSA